MSPTGQQAYSFITIHTGCMLLLPRTPYLITLPDLLVATGVCKQPTPARSLSPFGRGLNAQRASCLADLMVTMQTLFTPPESPSASCGNTIDTNTHRREPAR